MRGGAADVAAGEAAEKPLEVLATDAGGRPRPSLPVTLRAEPAGVSFLPQASQATGADGRASFIVQASGALGPVEVTATAPGAAPAHAML